MIVIDTNLIGYLFLESERTSLAQQALVQDRVWAAPFLWRSELRNVLAGYIRRGYLTLPQAIRIMDNAAAVLRGREYQVSTDAVLDLVTRSLCTAYDCEFVALAEELGVPLVTVDKQVIEQFPDIAVSLDRFVKG